MHRSVSRPPAHGCGVGQGGVGGVKSPPSFVPGRVEKRRGRRSRCWRIAGTHASGAARRAAHLCAPAARLGAHVEEVLPAAAALLGALAAQQGGDLGPGLGAMLLHQLTQQGVLLQAGRQPGRKGSQSVSQAGRQSGRQAGRGAGGGGRGERPATDGERAGAAPAAPCWPPMRAAPEGLESTTQRSWPLRAQAAASGHACRVAADSGAWVHNAGGLVMRQYPTPSEHPPPASIGLWAPSWVRPATVPGAAAAAPASPNAGTTAFEDACGQRHAMRVLEMGNPERPSSMAMLHVHATSACKAREN